MFFTPITLILTLVLSTCAFAGKLNVSLDQSDLSKMPASDLVYQGNRIDENEAFELKRSGVEIFKLNPYSSQLWQNKKHATNNYSTLNFPKKASLKFKNFKASPREIFRAQVQDPKTNRQFVITASLDNHTNVLRASLLRLLGYDLDVPKYYKKMTLKFDNDSQRSEFIDLVGEETLTKRDKWFIKKIGKTKLILKGFTLEPAELKNVNIHLPVMVRARQIDRRTFRSLIAIYALTDFPQKINDIKWKVGSSFNNNLSLNHPYAGEFKHTSYDDIKWILTKLNKLSRAEIKNALKGSSYPKDIEAIILEKLLSRINTLAQYFKLDTPYSINNLLTQGNIVGGRLMKGNYSDYVVDFYEKDPDNPYRFSEIFRLFKTQIIYSGLSKLLDTAIEKFVPGLYTQDAAQDVQGQISEFRQNNPSSDGVLPIKAFSSPLASGRVFANRKIVFGQYLGSNAPIQLVDSIGAEASLGVFTSLTGVSNRVLPNLVANVSFNRSFVHVRAMPDLTTASKQHIKKLLIPRVMKRLGNIIKDEYECSIAKKAFYEKTQLGDSEVYYVKYDKAWEDGKKQALALRSELIESGVSANTILMVVINRDELCTTQISDTRSKSIKSFVKEFAANETFIINDTLRLAGNITAPIPVPNVPGATISLGSENNTAMLKSVMLRKTDTGMEITIANKKDLRFGHKEGLNYYIEILSHAVTRTRGHLMSKIYKIDLEDIDEDEQKKAIKALREVLVSNNHDYLKKSYPPTHLDHDIWSRLRTLKLLWFKNEKMKMDHTVEVIVPNKEGQSFTQKERTRTLFSTFSIKRKGNDFQSFVDKILGTVASWLSIGSNGGDPGQSFLGNGKKVSIITESELTENYPLNPITRVEYSWTGWRKKTRKIEKYFKEIEKMYTPFTQNNLIDRTLFYSSPKLRSYDIRNTLILYPSAFERLKKLILLSDEKVAINALYNVYGHKRWSDYCQGEISYRCIPGSARSILKLRKNLPTDRIKLTKRINKIYHTLFNKFEISNVLSWLGQKNFFSSSRVTGFRENNQDGFIEHISDTVGIYNQEHGTGVFDRLGNHLNISPYELRAMSYTPGM